jgi:hypothetical protein
MAKTRTIQAQKRAKDAERKCTKRQDPALRQQEARGKRVARALTKNERNSILEKLEKAQRDLVAEQQRSSNLAKQITATQDLVVSLTEQVASLENDVAKFSANLAQRAADKQPDWQANPFVKRIFSVPSLCQSILHMSLERFNTLAEELTPFILSTNLQGQPYQRVHQQSVPPSQKLFITLTFLSLYPTQKVLGALFGMHEFDAIAHVRHVLAATSAHMAAKIKWPTEDEFAYQAEKWKSLMEDVLPDAVCAVDGTEIKIGKLTKGHMIEGTRKQTTWSVKHKQHSLNSLITCLLDGTIIHLTPCEEVHNDQQLMNKHNLRGKFEGKQWGVLADAGFFLNSKAAVSEKGKINAKTPTTNRKKKNQPKGKLSRLESIENTMLSRRRVIIENVNASLKRWGILAGKYRHYGGEANDVISVDLVLTFIAALHNDWIHAGHPMRHDGWVPAKNQDDLVELQQARAEEQARAALAQQAAPIPQPFNPGKQRCCSICRQPGHIKTKCPDRPAQ